MPNGDKNLGGVQNCPLKKSGILVQLKTYRSGGGVQAERKAVADVKVDVTGAQELPTKSTNGSGEVDHSGIKLGSYTCALKFPPRIATYYDVDGSTVSQTKDVGEKTQVYYFEVPYFWVEFEVKYPDGKFAPKIGWILQHQKPGTEKWTSYGEGETTEEKHTEEVVPKGKYWLALKLLSDPAWSKTELTVGEEIELSVKVSGFEAGAAGSFEVLDACDLSVAAPAIQAKVTGKDGAREMRVKWTPSSDDLKQLKRDHVVFRAKVASAAALSPVVPVLFKEQLDVVDDDGKPLDAKLTLRFSGGFSCPADVKAGKGTATAPWGQSLSRIDLADLKGARLTLDGTSLPQRKFASPV